MKLLVRHFFNGFFRLTFLDDAGEESFKRAIIGVLAGVIALGLFLSRLYIGKYAKVPADLRQWMLLADQMLVISIPMLTVTLVTALVAPSLFPDELDYRVLVPLPVSRRTIFVSKCVAALLFETIFIVGASVGMSGPFALVLGGGVSGPSLVPRPLAQLIASLLGATFAGTAAATLQGIIVVAVPPGWLRRTSIALQTVLVGGVVLAMPFVARVPTLWAALRAQPNWILFLPPAWFLGVQELLLGASDRYFIRLATIALVVAGLVMVAGAACYLVVYRRFDGVSLQSTHSAHKPRWWNPRLTLERRHHPVGDAVQRFTSVTLRRSGVHQLLFFSVFAAGVSLAVNDLLSTIGLSERSLMRTALGTPLTLMAGAMVGLRMTLLIPTNLRAGWIFRFTEAADTRRYQLNAVRRTLFGAGVVLPAVLGFPVQAIVVGTSTALAMLPLVLLLGWLFVEIVSLDWRRIPFTCTFLFAKRPAAYTACLGITIFGWFVFIGGSLLYNAASSMRVWIVVTVVLTSIGIGLHWQRLKTWGQFPLEFEDHLPDGFDTLRLDEFKGS